MASSLGFLLAITLFQARISSPFSLVFFLFIFLFILFMDGFLFDHLDYMFCFTFPKKKNLMKEQL